MKKSGISPEYIYSEVPGSYNMTEQKSFMGSKVMYIEDTIRLDNRDIIYYQQLSGEQFDLVQESNLEPNLYSISQDKFDNHTFGFNIDQSDIEKNSRTKWVIELNLRKLLINYIYANIKNTRSFEFIRNKDTQSKSVNESIYKYINNNIVDRYQYKSIELYIQYISLDENGINRFDVRYDKNIESEDNKFTNHGLIFTEDTSIVRILFDQQRDSKEFTFKYYFNVNFIKK